MPRAWSEFSGREWRHLRPFIERYKHARYQLRMAYHLRRKRLSEAELRGLAVRITGRKLLITIAYNDVELIAWQVKLIRKHVPDSVLLVADNSTAPEAAAAIAEIAKVNGLPYVRPPASPWRKASQGGRSHGLAMTWVWRSVIRPAKPLAFGFLDHDIFPLRPNDPFRLIAEYPVGGSVRTNFGRWYLWAGFCFFRFDAVEHVALNFSTDWAGGLDTGGCNWFPLYRRLDRRQVVDPGLTGEAIGPDIVLGDARFEWIGEWLHEANFQTPLELEPGRRQYVRARARQALLVRLSEALAGQAAQTPAN